MHASSQISRQNAQARPTGADLLVRMLVAYGVDTIFGVPGDTNVPLYAALRDAQDKLRHIMARDERSAGFMADAYARLSHRPAVVEVPSGAGALYAIPPIAEAQQSSIPLLLITSDTPISMEGQGVITELDCAKLFETVTKSSYQVKSARKIPEIIRRAFRLMTTGRPGAVHLAIPEDILAEAIDPETVSCHVEASCRTAPAYRTTVSQESLVALLDMISSAQRPLFILGGGVNASDAGAVVTRVAEILNIPAVTTITGQSAIPDHHPLSIGVIGDNGFHPHAMRALEEADLLIYLGSKIGSVATIGWTFPSPMPGRKIVQIDVDPVALGNNTDNVLSLCGDIRGIFEDLTSLCSETHVCPQTWINHLNAQRARFWEQVGPIPAADTPILQPQHVIQALGESLRGQVTLLSDAGTPTPNLTRFLRLDAAGSRLIIPRAFGGLGYAIPAVVGAWLAQPDVKIIGLFGDGSFSMSCGELETLRRLNVPALLLHFNNACFGWIKALQRSHGHNATYSVDFSADNVARIAEAFGLRSWRVTTMSQLTAALEEGLAHKGPAFIDIAIESIADVSPPVFSWLRRAGVDPLAIAADARIELGRGKEALAGTD